MTKSQKESRKARVVKPVDKDDQAAHRFVEDLVTRGEAARADENGDLPPGATHEIVEENKNGLPTVKRRRFSAF